MLSIYLSMVETDEERDLVTRIYTHFERMMYKIALGILKNPQDAEDAVSEAFIRIIKNLDKISGLDKEKCKGFVIIVIRNVAIDVYKKRKKDEHLNIDEAYDISGGDVENDFLEKYDTDVIHNAINSLKDEYRDIITMRYLYDMTINDISTMIGMTYDGTNKRLHRAEQSLFKIISEVDYVKQ